MREQCFDDEDNNSKKNPIIEKKDNYFDSYANLEIHRIMLEDKARMKFFKDSILNQKIFKDSIVLDVGCGTGIQSQYAMKANAKKIYAIEASDITKTTKKILEQNDTKNTIVLLNKCIEDCNYDINKSSIDILISEWMGYGQLYENMQPSVIYARDTFCRKDKFYMIPDLAKLYICGYNCISQDNEIKWKNYDDGLFNLSPLIPIETTTLLSTHIHMIEAIDICLTDIQVLHTLDLLKCTIDDIPFSKKIYLKIINDGMFNSLVLWFDTFVRSYDDTDTIAHTLTTSPTSIPTHWKQLVLLLPNTIDVTNGDSIELHVVMKFYVRSFSLFIEYRLVRENYTDKWYHGEFLVDR